MAAIFEKKREFWGRSDEISYLLEPVFGGRRQMTVIWGDSGIGKTRLLQEFHTRVAGGDFLSVYYHCLPDTAADPLLKCLHKLLAERIYRDYEDTWPGLIAQGLKRCAKRAQGLRNPAELARLLSSGLDVLASAPIKENWAKALKQGLNLAGDWLSPGTGIPQQMLPPLKPEVFADIVDVLQEAFPGRPLIFILDNLSADAESQHRIPGITNATLTLLSFAQSSFLQKKNVHFVVAWKHIAKTRPSFKELIDGVLQYQGRQRSLGPLKPEETREWLTSEFSWYRGADEDQQEAVLSIAKGQPEVISQWEEQEVNQLDLELLAKIEDENERYSPLATELRAEPPDAQAKLFQLAIMPSILGELALSVLWQCDPNDVHSFLEEWSNEPDRRGLLKRADGGYLFAHEKKQEVVRETLADVLLRGGVPAARRLHHFYLTHVGFPDETHPLAGLYLAFALALASWTDLAEGDRSWLSQASALDLDEGPAPSFQGNPMSRLQAAPAAARFFVFHRSVPRTPPGEGWVETLFQGLGRAPDISPLNLAKGLVNAGHAYRAQGNFERVEQLLARLEQLAGERGENAEIALAYAKGLVSAGNAYGAQGNFERVEQLLARLEQLAGERGENAEIALRYASGLVNAGHAYGAQGDFERVEQLLARLEQLAGERGENAEIALLYAKGLFNAGHAYGAQGDFERVEQLLARLEQLAGERGENAEIALRYANGLFNAGHAYGAQGDFERVEQLLARLEQLAGERGENAEIALRYANGLFNAGNAYRAQGNFERVEQLLARLEQLAGERGENAEIALEYAKGLFNAGHAYGAQGNFERVEQLLARLEQLAGERGENAEIALRYANGLFNAGNAYGAQGDFERVEEMLQQLEQLTAKHPENQGVAYFWALGLVLALGHGRVEREDVRAKLLDLLSRFGDPPQFQELLKLIDSPSEEEDPPADDVE